MHFEGTIPPHYLKAYTTRWIVLNLIHLIINIAFKLHRCLLRCITTHELLYIEGATYLSSLLFFIYGNVTDVTFPLSVYFIYTSLILLLLILSRFSYKFVNRILSKFSKSYNALESDCDLREALHQVVPTYRISPNGCTELKPGQEVRVS